MSRHTLSVLVENKPGVLARIAGLFARRGYNIDSLAVGPTEHVEVSRMTIVVTVEDSPLEQVTKQLNKLVEVIKIVELDGSASVNRELLLVKVRADAESRGQILDVVELFRAKVVDVSPDTVVVQAIGNVDKLADLRRLLEPFGIRELVQSGHGRHRPRPSLDLRADPAPGRRTVPVTGWMNTRSTGCPVPLRSLQRSRSDSKRPRSSPAPPPEGAPTVAQMFYDDDADLALIQGKNVAVLGYGSQGHAHALSLRDSGVDVRVGLPEGSKSRAKAVAEGLRVLTPAEAVEEADVIVILAPDHKQRQALHRGRRAHITPGDTLVFGHGFNIRFGYITPPAGVDVFMVAPKGPGHLVRREYVDGRGVPVLVAVEKDESGKAWDARAVLRQGDRRPARGRHPHDVRRGDRDRPVRRAGRALRRGVPAVMYGFEVLTEAGYQPEVAYFECLHELKLIVDLMYEGGIAKQRWSVSDTAEYGDYVSGPRVLDAHVKDNMKQILAEIKNGTFAQRFIDDQDAGGPEFQALREKGEQHPIEQTGRELRKLMAWVKSHDDDYTEGTATR